MSRSREFATFNMVCYDRSGDARDAIRKAFWSYRWTTSYQRLRGRHRDQGGGRTTGEEKLLFVQLMQVLLVGDNVLGNKV